MLMNLQPTPLDLNWRMFGIPIRVHPSYWLVSLFFAWSIADGRPAFLLIAIACMFVSILAHELGHALMFRAYHMHSFILLYGLGGLAFPDGALPRRSWRIKVSLAGPLTNFLIAGIVWGSNYVEPWDGANQHTSFVFGILILINLAYGIFNLFPVWPLDGGKVSREIWVHFDPWRGVVKSLKMSMAVAIAVVCYTLIPPNLLVWWLNPGIFGMVLFGFLALENWTELRNTRSYYDDSRPPWRR